MHVVDGVSRLEPSLHGEKENVYLANHNQEIVHKVLESAGCCI